MIIVLSHGIFGFEARKFGPIEVAYFRNIAGPLEALGHAVITTGVDPIGTIEERAGQLRNQINRKIRGLNPPAGDQRILLFGYSMGGLDARHMLSKLADDPANDPAPTLKSRVVALVTIVTPHSGSLVADIAHRLPGMDAAEKLLQRVTFAPVADLLSDLIAKTGGIKNLTTSFCTAFNRTTPNAPNVKYFSIGADCGCGVPLYFQLTHRMVAAAQGDNDGIVSVNSAHPDSDPQAAGAIGPWTRLPSWPVDHCGAANLRLPNAPVPPSVPDLYVELLEQLKVEGIA